MNYNQYPSNHEQHNQSGNIDNEWEKALKDIDSHWDKTPKAKVAVTTTPADTYFHIVSSYNNMIAQNML